MTGLSIESMARRHADAAIAELHRRGAAHFVLLSVIPFDEDGLDAEICASFGSSEAELTSLVRAMRRSVDPYDLQTVLDARNAAPKADQEVVKRELLAQDPDPGLRYATGVVELIVDALQDTGVETAAYLIGEDMDEIFADLRALSSRGAIEILSRTASHYPGA